MYPNFSSELNSLDKFFPLTSHTHIFFFQFQKIGVGRFLEKKTYLKVA